MDIGSILIGIALGIAVAAYIAKPLIQHEGQLVTEVDRHLSELQAERDRVLSRILELDMDFTMGKLLEADFRTQRDALVLRGAEVLKELEAEVGVEAADGQVARLEDEIEAAVAKIRNKDDAGTIEFCTSCGERVQSGDRFCTRCGTPVSSGGTSA
jgi:hypothetical protein